MEIEKKDKKNKKNKKNNIKIGKSATDNWIILSEAKPTDVFFHLTHYPSPYVILSTESENGRESGSESRNLISPSLINRCAEICKEHTKYRRLRRLSVDYTPCSNVRRGEQLGEVIYVSNRKVKTVVV